MIRLAIRVAGHHAEQVLAELLELVPDGLEEVELQGGIVEYAVYGAAGELPSLPDLQAAAGGALVEVSTSEVADDWSQRWQQFHRPLVLEDRLTVRPPWEPRSECEIDVVIDPAMAFGTGAHATTRLCLELLLELAEAQQIAGSFLDLGCGSGVLAITAAKLGFDPVLAVDNDALSLDATKANAAVNAVRVQARRLDLRVDALPAADTVVANLLGPLLRTLAARLDCSGTQPRRLLASGLLCQEADELAGAFGSRGLHEVARRERQGWTALLLAR